MKLFVVRHGQTDWNLERKLQGQVDTELNENGVKQANELKSDIKNQDYKIDLIIASPLKRTKKTAEIISDGKIDIIYSDKIIERGFGELEGIKIDRQDKDTMNSLYDLNYKGKYKKLEPLKDLCNRTFNFLDEIKEKYHDKNIMLVTHGGTIRAINAYFNGIPENRETG